MNYNYLRRSVMCDNRCEWAQRGLDNMKLYHDTEWGVPLNDDLKLFEFLVLDAFQAGLTWQLILNKRETFRKAFDGFNPEIIARYDQIKIDELLTDSGIVRNKLKVNSTVTNAQSFLKIVESQGSFSDYIWNFSDGKTIVNQFKSIKEVPASTPLSDKMSKKLKSDGFKFVGSTICYAFMQAMGMVNDHTVDCFRYREVMK